MTLIFRVFGFCTSACSYAVFVSVLAYSSRTCFILCCHCFFMIAGEPWLAWAWAKAAVIMGELSVRIVVPMDMKKLFRR